MLEQRILKNTELLGYWNKIRFYFLQRKITNTFFGRKFILNELKPIDLDDKERIILGFMMMVLLERRRG